MSAKFLRHEGFLGAVGAFLKVHPMTPPNQALTGSREPRKVRCDSVALCPYLHHAMVILHKPRCCSLMLVDLVRCIFG